MVIDSIFVYHFVDPDLRVEIIFRKEGTAEKWGIDFVISDISTSAHWYWRLKKIMCRACLLFYYFLLILSLKGSKKAGRLCIKFFATSNATVQRYLYPLFQNKCPQQLLKALLTCTFIHSLLNFFALHSCSCRWRKRFTLRLPFC